MRTVTASRNVNVGRGVKVHMAVIQQLTVGNFLSFVRKIQNVFILRPVTHTLFP